MRSKYLRYNSKALASLGYVNIPDPDLTFCPHHSDSVLAADMQVIYNGFENVIKAVFSCLDDSPTLNTLGFKVTDSMPRDVIDFANLVLNANIPALKSAPDADTAMALIFPRESDVRHFSAYADRIREYVQSNIDNYSKTD